MNDNNDKKSQTKHFIPRAAALTLLQTATLIGPAAAAVAADDVFPAEIELASIAQGDPDGNDGIFIVGAGGIGDALGAAGDINGDGFNDIVLGTPYASPIWPQIVGRSFVVYGTDAQSTVSLSLESLRPENGADGTLGLVLTGADVGDRAGHSVAAAGDFNGDGIDDLIVGAPALANSDGYRGKSYVVYGSDQGLPAEIELANLHALNGGDGSVGFVFRGVNSFDRTGISVGVAGDLNADGKEDIVIGASGADPGGRDGAGQTYVVYGQPQWSQSEMSSALLPGTGGSFGFAINGIEGGVNNQPGDWSGHAVRAAGDLNADGIDDLVVGAIWADPAGEDKAGQAYVVFGDEQGFGGQFELSGLLAANGGDGSAGFVLHGIGADFELGRSVAAAGDLNGDGIDDLVVGASHLGDSYVIFGDDQGFPAEIDPSSLYAANGGTGDVGSVIVPAGWKFVGAAGDMNGDGVQDLAVGMPHDTPGGRFQAGRVYVVFGGMQDNQPELDLTDLLEANGGDGSKGFALNGAYGYEPDNPAEGVGVSVASAGDFNNDGVDDLLVGTQNNPRVYLVFGRDADLDDDGIDNALDNCTEVANPNQRDTNGDGFGNLCDADLNGDLIVNAIDLGLFKAVFFGADADADFNGDGAVNAADLGIMRLLFLQPPGPSGLVQ